MATIKPLPKSIGVKATWGNPLSVCSIQLPPNSVCWAIYVSPASQLQQEIKIERVVAAHQLQSCHTTGSLNNLTKSKSEASSLVAEQQRRAERVFFQSCSTVSEPVCVCLSEAHTESLTPLWAKMQALYLSPYLLTPVLTPSQTSHHPSVSNSSHTPAVTRRWRPCNIQITKRIVTR